MWSGKRSAAPAPFRIRTHSNSSEIRIKAPLRVFMRWLESVVGLQRESYNPELSELLCGEIATRTTDSL